jgi:hypothetical protein
VYMLTYNIQEYLSIALSRLANSDYTISKNIKYDDIVYECIAKKTKKETIRYGLFNTSFLFSILDKPDLDTLEHFSSVSFRFSLKTSGFHPPRGLFYGLLVIPVAIVSSIDDSIVKSIQNNEPPKHFAAFEKLVVVSLENSSLYYCRGIYSWGSQYFEYDRALIRQMLSLY